MQNEDEGSVPLYLGRRYGELSNPERSQWQAEDPEAFLAARKDWAAVSTLLDAGCRAEVLSRAELTRLKGLTLEQAKELVNTKARAARKSVLL